MHFTVWVNRVNLVALWFQWVRRELRYLLQIDMGMHRDRDMWYFYKVEWMAKRRCLKWTTGVTLPETNGGLTHLHDTDRYLIIIENDSDLYVLNPFLLCKILSFGTKKQSCDTDMGPVMI